jgi:hypothetical protein
LSYEGRVEFSERSIMGAAMPGKSHGTTNPIVFSTDFYTLAKSCVSPGVPSGYLFYMITTISHRPDTLV